MAEASKNRARFKERAELLDFLLEVSSATAETLDLDQLLGLTKVFLYLRLLARRPLLRDPEFVEREARGLGNVDQNTASADDGGGDCAIRSTDVLRFNYLLLHHGRWRSQQLVPAEYVGACGRPSPCQKHAPFSLMFEVNADGQKLKKTIMAM